MPEETPDPVEGYKKWEAAQAPTELAQKPYACTYSGCTRSFDSPQGLSMHKVRVHTHRRKKKSREQIQAHKRAYNTAYRARNRAQGLTSTGHPRKRAAVTGEIPFYKTPQYRKEKYDEQVKRYRALGLNSQGKPFKSTPDSHWRSRLSKKGLSNILKSQRKRRLREAREKQAQLNGAITPLPLAQSEAETDNMGETAKAVILAAQVLRSVSLGLKL